MYQFIIFRIAQMWPIHAMLCWEHFLPMCLWYIKKMSEKDTSIPPMPMTNSTQSSLVSLAVEPTQRRCSARLLSQSVHQTLRQLQKDEHEIRVAQLVKKNQTFYKQQKVCESFSTFSILVSFSGECLDNIYKIEMSMYLVSILCLHCLVLWFSVLPHPQLPLSQHLLQPGHGGGGGGHPHVHSRQPLGVVQVW